MSRRKNKQQVETESNVVDIRTPTAFSRDELAAFTLPELEELHRRYELEREVVVDNSSADPRPWEVELAYIERAIDNRRAYEAVTPRYFWN
jgi:hypothetical protein